MTTERKRPDVDELLRRAEDAETMIADLVTKLDERKHELAALREELGERDAKIAALERRLAELSKSHGLRIGDLSDRERQIKGLVLELERKGAEARRLAGELEKAKLELDRVRTDANQEIAALREIIDRRF